MTKAIKYEQTQRDTGFRALIPFYILFDLDLNANHHRFYGQIEQMESNPSPKVSPTFSFAWMAVQLGINERNTKVCAKKLKEKGYIEHIKTPKGWVWRTVKAGVLITECTESTDSTSVAERHPGVSPSDTFGGGVAERHPKSLELDVDLNILELNTTLVDSPNTTRKTKPSSYKQDERFMKFYNAYPKKEKPADAWKAFKALAPSDEKLCEIVADVEERKLRHTQWSEKKYIPLPASYLRTATYDGEINNDEEQRQEKKTAAAVEAAAKAQAQELASKQRADRSRRDHENKHNDGQLNRLIAGGVAAGRTEMPEGLRNFGKMTKR